MKLKSAFVLLFLFNITHSLTGQETTKIKYPIDKNFYEAVDKWVMFPENNNDSTYLYGFIYIDETAGFTFDCVNSFSIDNEGKFVPYPLESPLNLKARIDRNWHQVGIIPDEKLEELGLPLLPEWLPMYKINEGSDKYAVRMGYFYNAAGASELALGYLEGVYGRAPDTEGLPFELSFAYNALHDYEKGALVAERALMTDPDNFLLYKELIHALCNMGRMEEAEAAVATGMEKTENRHYKSEMAINMAQAYYIAGNREKFEEWYDTTKKHAIKGSYVDQYADHLKAGSNNADPE